MKGYVHSIETFGSVDGPGIRLVVFLQGCPMRCLYCHNPDTWTIGVGEEVEPAEIIRIYERNKMFYRGGGITVTGGEPLLQIDFLAELFALAKEQGIHTCIDTSGAAHLPDSLEYMKKLDGLLRNTDLVLLDIKHVDGQAHRRITSRGNENILSFARHLAEMDVPVWIRHVVVKGYTDDAESLRTLGRFVGGMSNVEALDVLPYHTLGEKKYEALGIDYPLSGMPPLTKEETDVARGYIIEGIRDARRNK